MTDLNCTFLLCVLAYVVGSIPFGLLVAKFKGVDLRQKGSGNIGAANAIRILGMSCGVAVLLGDTLKGIAVLMLAKRILGPAAPPLSILFVGLSAILGHNYSVFLKFHGGKGVATTLGVFLFLSWKATLAAFSFWVIVVLLFRFASLASIIATLMLPVFMKVFGEPDSYFFFSWIAFFFVLYQHRDNIARLIRGEENKLSFSCKKEQE